MIAGRVRHDGSGRAGNGQEVLRARGLLPAEPLPQRVSRLMAWAAGALILLGCGFLISLDVVTRSLAGRGVIESFELSGYALAGAVGLGLAFTVTSRANIRVDIAVTALPAALRRPVDLLAALALAVAAVVLAIYGWETLATSWRMGARSVSRMQTPLVVPQVLWWAGLAWFALVAVLVPVQAVRRLAAGDGRGCDALIGPPGVKDEIEQAGDGAGRP
jgi:TRAP-type C4-dicarboxylate transport system permease small subunit